MRAHEIARADAATQAAWSVLDGLARAGAATPLAPDSPPPLPPEELQFREDVPIPHWSEETLRDLLESLPDAMVVINRGGAIVMVNQQTVKVFGYQREELLRRPIEMLIPERSRRKHVGQRNGYFARPETRPMGTGLPLFGRRKDGSEFPVEISLNPLRTKEGAFATAVIRDVSQRKRDEAKFRTLVENIPAVTFIAPLDESVPELYVSPQIEQLLGFSQKEWLEDPVLWHRQLHPEDRERWNHQFAPTCASGKPFEDVYRFVAKDGRVVWVHGSASVVRDADGTPSFLQGVAFDVTSIKEAEDALRKAKEELRRNNADLEQRVEKRTAELALSMTELREKTEELEKFAYVTSHDLREPLRSLVNFPEKLAKNYGGKIDAQADLWIGKTIDGATRMRRLIDDLAKYARVLLKDQQFEPVDCGEVVGEASANLQAAVEESGAAVVLSDLPTVMGNRQHLMLLFQNLIGNAIKFRDPNRPVHVAVGARPQDNGWLFWVRDNGIGIEAKYLVRIFALGERLNSATKYPGTGFGLAICEKIVVRHGGRIWAESALDQGSTFFFTLPALPPVAS